MSEDLSYLFSEEASRETLSRHSKGHYLFDAKDYEGAMSEFRAFLAEAPASESIFVSSAHLSIGLCLEKMGQFEASLREIERAAEACTSYDREHKGNALHHRLLFLHRHPNFWSGELPERTQVDLLERLQTLDDDPFEQVECLQGALVALPSDARVAHTLGRLNTARWFSNRDRTQEAIGELSSGILFIPESADYSRQFLEIYKQDLEGFRYR